MNQLHLAIRDTVQEFEPGTNVLFALMGATSRQRLLNKACPTTTNTHFSPEELVRLQNITGDYRINDVMRLLESRQIPSERSITQSLLSITDELGAMARQIAEAEEDGVYTEGEKADCLKQLVSLENACGRLKKAIHSQEVGQRIHAV